MKAAQTNSAVKGSRKRGADAVKRCGQPLWTTRAKMIMSLTEAQMLKLVRDWLEKFSAGSMLVAAYQSSIDNRGLFAFSLGAVAFAGALYLAKRGSQ
jgi:hypothetical protein